MMLAAKGEHTVGELLGTLARDTAVLLRQEVQLASSEMTAKTKGAARALATIGAGGALAQAGFLAVTFALVVGLGTWIAMWLSALLVGVSIVAAGCVLLQKGVSALKKLDPVPRQTIQTLKDDGAWVKEQSQ